MSTGDPIPEDPFLKRTWADILAPTKKPPHPLPTYSTILGTISPAGVGISSTPITTGGIATTATTVSTLSGKLMQQEEEKPKDNDIEVIDNFQLIIGETKLVLTNASKDLIEIITKIMLKDRNDEENKPTEYGED